MKSSSRFGSQTSTLIKKIARLLIRLSSRDLAKLHVAHAYSFFLIELWKQDKQTQAMLYKNIGIEQPTAVKTINRMERDGLITKERSNDDRRAIHICLTRKANQLQNSVFQCSDRLNKVLLNGFSNNEKKQLRDYLSRIENNIQTSLEQE